MLLAFLKVLTLHLPLVVRAAFASLRMHHVILLQEPIAEPYPAENYWIPGAGLHDVWAVGGQPTVGALGNGGQGQMEKAAMAPIWGILGCWSSLLPRFVHNEAFQWVD